MSISWPTIFIGQVGGGERPRGWRECESASKQLESIGPSQVLGVMRAVNYKVPVFDVLLGG